MTPDDPRHGTTAGKPAHLRDGETPCDPCRLAWNKRQNDTRRLKAYGRWEPWADAQPVRDHVRTLMGEGMGYRAIAKQAGISVATIGYLLYGRDGYGAPAQVRTRTADALMATTLEPWLIPATGTARRLRALAALGYTRKQLSEVIDIWESVVTELIEGRHCVTKPTAAKVAAVYSELSMKPGGSRIAVKVARQRGWAPPLAWDDHTIDDPEASPQGMPGERWHMERHDEDAIAEALDGAQVRLTVSEKRVVVAEFLARGWTYRQITERANIQKPERYARRRDGAA